MRQAPILVLLSCLLSVLSLPAQNQPGSYEQAFLDHAFRPAPRSINPLILLPPYDPFPSERTLSARHYPASNENRLDLFLPYIQEIGGGYVGVGTDQNLLLMGRARSEFGYLIDFDPAAVGINRIHLFFLRIAPDAAAFRDYWKYSARKSSWQLLKKEFAGQDDFASVQLGWDIAQASWRPVENRLKEQARLARDYGLRGYFNDPADYAHLRSMVAAGRIQALPGDLNGSKSLRSVARAAGHIGRPIRILYLSNAEDYFPFYSAEFRQNAIHLPADEQSLVLRTCSIQTMGLSHPQGESNRQKPFHYNIEPLIHLQRTLAAPGTFRVTDLLRVRRDLKAGLSLRTFAGSARAENRAGVETRQSN
ncbi:MAG: hypothetical protein HS115_02385 [Spirochaetales bacterium]|nr:hypothetical protein [Spirochaetales bacterium]